MIRAISKHLFGLVLLSLSASPATAQDLPLDDKARFEKTLEQKIEAVLVQMLGPGQAKVAVDATIDFTRVEKVDLKMAELGVEGQQAASRYLWENMERDRSSQPQLMPGFSFPQGGAGAMVGGNQKYERQLTYPESFLKRLTITILLNRTLPEDQAENVNTVVTELAGIKPERGDTLSILRADFPPPWRTIWYRPESADMVLRYAAIALMAVLSLSVVGICFLKLTEAMRAMARAQMHQVQMEVPGMGGTAPTGEAEGAKALQAPEKGEETPEEEATFDVQLEQVDTLANMIGREDPANIALVVVHLKPEVRSAFLARLPQDATARVMVAMAKPRFVDPETLASLREELERRLKGMVGGLQQALELITNANLKTKKAVLDHLQGLDPLLAREVRLRTLMLEDLFRLSEIEWGLLSGEIKLEDWATALHDAPQGLGEKLKAQFTPRAWLAIEQTMASRLPPEEKVQEAHEKIAAAVWKLIQEGRVANPLRSLPEMLAAAPGPGPEKKG